MHDIVLSPSAKEGIITMQVTRRLLSIAAAASLASLGMTVGTVSHAFAATACDDGAGGEWKEVPILTSPITLAVEIGDNGTPTEPHVGICWGTNSEAQNSQGQPEVAGGDIFVNALDTGSTLFPTGAAVLWDPNSEVQAPVVAWATPTTTTNQGPGGENVTVGIPFSACFGTGLIGPSTCSTGSPTIGATGLIVSNVALGGAPAGTTTGATISPSATLYVDGIPEPLGAGPTGAGLNVGTGFGPTVPICAVICVQAPSAWAGVPAGPTPIGAVDIAGTQVTVPNVFTAPACVSTPGATCPAPY